MLSSMFSSTAEARTTMDIDRDCGTVHGTVQSHNGRADVATGSDLKAPVLPTTHFHQTHFYSAAHQYSQPAPLNSTCSAHLLRSVFYINKIDGVHLHLHTTQEAGAQQRRPERRRQSNAHWQQPGPKWMGWIQPGEASLLHRIPGIVW